ncbi:MAG TPA: cysteine dioxygenase family protein [Acidimicrobiales bacterium]|nr:cysteine dioxygenase family protein [Acidimicrobiales bacterium]
MPPPVLPFPSASRQAHPAGGSGGPPGADPDGGDRTGGGAGGDTAGRLSFTALRAIAAGLARTQAAVPPAPGDDPSAPRSIRLLATTFYDVWLITWPAGSALAAHDHGAARSVLQVVAGQLTETVAFGGGGPGAARTEPCRRELWAGDATEAEPSAIHELANRSGADATTVHVYSPPLAGVAFYDLGHPGPAVRLRTAPVADKEPQASSRDLPRPGAVGAERSRRSRTALRRLARRAPVPAEAGGRLAGT